MPTSMARATAIALQADASVPETTPTETLNYVVSCEISDVPTSEIAKYERGTRALSGDRRPGTLYSRVRLVVDVDSRQFPMLLLPGAGYAFSTTHSLYFGDDPATFMALWHYDGITSEARYIDGLILNTAEIALDYTAGTVRATLEYLGNQWTSVTDPGATFTIPATHPLAFVARQAVLLKATAAFCPLTATINFNNNVQPRYCGPSADATTTDPLYLAPDELQAREAEGTLALTAQFVGYTGSIIEDSRTNTERQYTLKMKDPAGTPVELLWTFPRVNAEPGTLDVSLTNPEQRLTVNAALLVDSAGRLATLVVTNDEGAYLS